MRKELISIRLEPSTLARLRASGPGWQTRLAAVIDAIAQGMPAPKPAKGKR